MDRLAEEHMDCKEGKREQGRAGAVLFLFAIRWNILIGLSFQYYEFQPTPARRSSRWYTFQLTGGLHRPATYNAWITLLSTITMNKAWKDLQ